ncbi:MAG: hypothetical protein GF330_12675 [Candidatus Eisenbacteria bacterium]|nr:hypothetical protein [Candidatus Eisenbacteria bacterium]
MEVIQVGDARYALIKWSSRRTRRRVGVICTIGPAVYNPPQPDLLEELIRGGMNIARINLSHYRLASDKPGECEPHPADRDKLLNLIRRIREVSDKLCTPVNIMFDLRGPEIRVAKFRVHSLDDLDRGRLRLAQGSTFSFVPENLQVDRASGLLVERPLLVVDKRTITKLQGRGRKLTFTANVGGRTRSIRVERIRSEMRAMVSYEVTQTMPESNLPLDIEDDSALDLKRTRGSRRMSVIVKQVRQAALRLAPGMKIRVTADRAFRSSECSVVLVDYEGDLGLDVEHHVPSDPIFVENGRVRLLLASDEDHLHPLMVVKSGETIALRKSMNFFNNPRDSVTRSTSDVDRAYLRWVLNEKTLGEPPIDSVAVSFVREHGDLREVANLIETECRSVRDKIKLIAKIESPHCFMKQEVAFGKRTFKQDSTEFAPYEEILDRPLCWGVMIARGDLGAEIEPERVPEIQEGLADRANIRGKAVIVATQMLTSMMNADRPSRADVSDMRNAVLCGADVLMLSEETAAGKYPLKALEQMQRTIMKATAELQEPRRRDRYLEKFRTYGAESGVTSEASPEAATIMELLGKPMVEISDQSGSPVIFSYALTGGSVMKIPKYRPRRAIIALSTSEWIARNLLFYYGVFPIVIAQDVEDPVADGTVRLPREWQGYEEFLSGIITAARRNAHMGNPDERELCTFSLERLSRIKPNQIVFGLLGIGTSPGYDRAIIIFRYKER